MEPGEKLVPHLHWQAVRLLAAVNALVFDTNLDLSEFIMQRLWPKGYSKEYPGWAIGLEADLFCHHTIGFGMLFNKTVRRWRHRCPDARCRS